MVIHECAPSLDSNAVLCMTIMALPGLYVYCMHTPVGWLTAQSNREKVPAYVVLASAQAVYRQVARATVHVNSLVPTPTTKYVSAISRAKSGLLPRFPP